MKNKISDESLRFITSHSLQYAKNVDDKLKEDPKADIFHGSLGQGLTFIFGNEYLYPEVTKAVKEKYPYVQSLIDAQHADNHDEMVEVAKKDADQALKLMAEGNDPYSGQLQLILGVLSEREHNDPSITQWMDKHKPAVQNQIDAINGYHEKS